MVWMCYGRPNVVKMNMLNFRMQTVRNGTKRPTRHIGVSRPARAARRGKSSAARHAGSPRGAQAPERCQKRRLEIIRVRGIERT